MKQNINNTEGWIRIVIGVIILSLGYAFESWWGLIGLIPLITGLLGRCPLYSVLGISTCKTSSNQA